MKKEISETCKYFESGDKMSAYGEPECLKCACKVSENTITE